MISAKEVQGDKNALQTVIDGKRPIGYISTIYSEIDDDYLWNKINENNLKILKVKEGIYIVYIESAQNDAKELLEIAKKYGGSLHWNATESDTRRIGELLSYCTDDINEHILRIREGLHHPLNVRLFDKNK